MNLGTQAGGVAVGLGVDYVKLAAKTGTAELGSQKQFVNSWVTGFFPYDNPKYAFAIIMEKGPVTNTMGGVYVMRQVLDWIYANEPEYFKL
jgi:cell division protein FtsI/penicillin-binding protein 2